MPKSLGRKAHFYVPWDYKYVTNHQAPCSSQNVSKVRLKNQLLNFEIVAVSRPCVKAPVKLMQWVKIAHLFLQSVSNLF